MDPRILKAYPLGVFDGEGCITAGPRSNGYVGLHVTVQMASREIVELFHTTWGGCSPRIRKRPKPDYAYLYVWTVTGCGCIPFLEDAVETLIEKKSQAQNALLLALEMQKSKDQRNRVNARLGQRVVMAADHDHRQALASQIKQANGARNRYAQQQ